MAYARAYAAQCEWCERIVAGRETAEPILAHVLLVEHDPPVVTVTARPGAPGHVLASADQLAAAGVEVASTDRGGDVTYHGPGQIVAYPIVDLNAHGLRLHDYMRLLEGVVIDTCAEFGVPAMRDRTATGVWTVDGAGLPAAKIAAMGVRVRRWVAMHGLALNVAPNLDHFGLIVPCGLVGRRVTSLERELGPDRCPSIEAVKASLAARLLEALAARRRTLTPSSDRAPPDRRSPAR